MGGVTSVIPVRVGNLYHKKVWVKYDAEQSNVHASNFGVDESGGITAFGSKACVQFQPIKPGQYMRFDIKSRGHATMYMTVIADDGEIICNTLPRRRKGNVVITEDGNLRSAEPDNPLMLMQTIKVSEDDRKKECQTLMSENGEPNICKNAQDSPTAHTAETIQTEIEKKKTEEDQEEDKGYADNKPANDEHESDGESGNGNPSSDRQHKEHKSGEENHQEFSYKSDFELDDDKPEEDKDQEFTNNNKERDEDESSEESIQELIEIYEKNLVSRNFRIQKLNETI